MIKNNLIYSESIEYVNEQGLKRWKRFELSASINEEDILLECWKELEDDVREAKKQSFGQKDSPYPYSGIEMPSMEWNGNTGIITQIPTIDHKKQELLDRINESPSLEELNKIMNEAFQKGLVNEFITKKKQFQVV